MVPGRPGPGERAGRRGRAKPPDSGAARTLGNAHWIGVRLADLLAEAGVRPPSRGGPADQLIARSVEGLALDPVATAASNNEALTTLVGAVDAAGLVDTLNDARDITVFAPVDDAFAAIPEEDLNAVLADEELLTGVLTYHVMGERIAPEQLADGTFETLQGGTVTTAGSGESFTVNDEAAVVCGNVQTANATVYLIDTVLMP
ncbi:fasciclin domain-containing protein [Streptomyces carpaticus]|uniref:Fasciclin domain-containing protein n=1 Tax=Streptomyces carpaticus TaxID=285558 RepID=A0ABV4ZPA7_9ACTN